MIERLEVRKEEAAVQTIGALEGRYEDRRKAVRSRQQTNKRNQDNGGLRKRWDDNPYRSYTAQGTLT
jgi:hypothetical protein